MLLLALACSLTWVTPATAAGPQAVNGLMDLSDWDFREDGNVELSGLYEFYWRRFLDRRELLTEQPTHYAMVPGPWNNIMTDAGPAPGHGYATYRLTVLVGPNLQPMSLKIKDFGTSGKVFINGEEVLRMGYPGNQARNTISDFEPQVIDFIPEGQRIELVFHVANFDHRRGGLWEPILLGTRTNVHRYDARVKAYDLLMSGGLLMIAIFNIALFLVQRSNYASLFLALFSVFGAVRILSVNDRLLLGLFPDIGFTFLSRLEYLSWFLMVAFFSHFLHSLFSRELGRGILWMIDAIVAACALVVMTTQLAVFSWTAPFMQVFHALIITYGFYVMLLARRHRRPGANILLFGYAFLAICTVNDILVAAGVFITPNLVELGIMMFTICQTMLASYTYARSMQTVEQQYEQLATSSLKLQTQEKLRLEAEMESRKVAARFKESQQFEALGLLAHGIVSDLKESFSHASQEAVALADALKSEPELLQTLENTRVAADRSVAVIEDLLSLSRFDTDSQVTDINDVIERYFENPRLKELAEERQVTLEVNAAESIQPVAGSRLHIERILQNLINNAFDSQPDGGTTIISTEQIYTDGRTLFYDALRSGYYVILSVEDKGSGIHPEDLDSIFQPFFSRRDVSTQGMGLGMSVVRAIVRQLHGGIDVISEMGQGSRFDIYLPVATPH